MTASSTQRRLPALAGLILLLALAALVALSAQAPRAGAAQTSLTVGSLDWGIKQSFRQYIVGGIANGEIQVGGGASTNPDGTFAFPLADGSYEAETQATVAAFAGWVRFTGHHGDLDLKVSSPRIELVPDGARLLADLESVPYPAGGEPVSYPDVEVAKLDLTGVDPVVDAGTTTWTDLPAVLAPTAVGAFGGFYGAGTALDPVSFQYEGPGGKPIPESWTAPGTPHFEQVASGENAGGIGCGLFVDPDNGVVHVVHTGGVAAFDLDTLDPSGDHAVAGLEQFGCALDPETGTVFARQAGGNVLAYRYQDGDYVAQLEVPMTAERTLNYDPATDSLWAIGTSAPAPTFQGNPTVAVATRDGAGGWNVDTGYSPIETGGRNVESFTRSSTGALIGAYSGQLDSGPPPQILPSPTAVFTDDGSELVPTEIAGTAATAPPGGGMTTGYVQPAAGPDGEVALYETTISSSSTRVLRLVPDTGAASGYAVLGTPHDVGVAIRSTAYDRDDGSLYVATADDRLLVLRGEAQLGQVAQLDAATGLGRLAGGDGRVYGVVSGSEIVAYAQTGVSPTITQQPTDTTVTLEASGDSAEATFTATAGGAPQPDAVWQRRAPGDTAWSEVPGASAETLVVDADAASAGSRYRAVFENPGGRIASQAATLSVTIQPPAEAEPGSRADDGADPSGGDRAPESRGGDPRQAARRPLLRSPRAARVRARGVASVARVRCRGPRHCRLRTSRRARVRIAGRNYPARVLAPRFVKNGSAATVRVRIGRGAVRVLRGPRKPLAGKRADARHPGSRVGIARFRVAVRSGNQHLARVVAVRLRR